MILGIIGTEYLETEHLGQESLFDEDASYALADEIEFDDHRGLKFKDRRKPVEPPKSTNRKPTVQETQNRPCPIPKTKGGRCSNLCDLFRPACHIHDPDGVYAKQYPKYRRKMIAELKRLGIENKWG